MALTLPAMIVARATTMYQRFVKEIQAVTAEQSQRYSHANWPSHRWGIGQNGSIAGIVYHVAAWKQMTLPLLQGENAVTIREFEVGSFPQLTDWTEIVAWYERIGAEWIEQVTNLNSEDYDKTLNWEGMAISTTKLVMEIIDHDIQHASQIEYLRQRLLLGD